MPSTELHPLVRRIETQRQWIMDFIDGTDVKKLNSSPAEGRWSILEVVNHLYLSEQLSLAYLKKKWGYSPVLKDAGVMTWIRYQLLIFSMRQPFKIKTPRRANVRNGDINPVLLMDQWKIQREELIDFLKVLPVEVHNKEFYKHPLAGKIRIDHMLGFFYYHTRRHIGQITRTLRDVSGERKEN
jgi:uncharacterized damage-inducible protein DinB